MRTTKSLLPSITASQNVSELNQWLSKWFDPEYRENNMVSKPPKSLLSSVMIKLKNLQSNGVFQSDKERIEAFLFLVDKITPNNLAQIGFVDSLESLLVYESVENIHVLLSGFKNNPTHDIKLSGMTYVNLLTVDIPTAANKVWLCRLGGTTVEEEAEFEAEQKQELQQFHNLWLERLEKCFVLAYHFQVSPHWNAYSESLSQSVVKTEINKKFKNSKCLALDFMCQHIENLGDNQLRSIVLSEYPRIFRAIDKASPGELKNFYRSSMSTESKQKKYGKSVVALLGGLIEKMEIEKKLNEVELSQSSNTTHQISVKNNQTEQEKNSLLKLDSLSVNKMEKADKEGEIIKVSKTNKGIRKI